jgi:hypothetical protein
MNNTTHPRVTREAVAFGAAAPIGPRVLTVKVTTPDLEAEDGWSDITIVFQDVDELFLRENSSTALILNCGVTLMEHEGGVFADFYEAESDVDFARSHSGFYVLARSVAISHIAPSPSWDERGGMTK